ncbi:unnamed protein product [Protopolystoma xenopodis]|uniref:Uncharacterized protein n=1 Tax=Protopolystoma xenopodis TaxID=117903 RepID=A0A3S5BU81_9PLAT|nr:unnamed protein product [Protopolystoma xenopodis]
MARDAVEHTWAIDLPHLTQSLPLNPDGLPIPAVPPFLSNPKFPTENKSPRAHSYVCHSGSLSNQTKLDTCEASNRNIFSARRSSDDMTAHELLPLVNMDFVRPFSILPRRQVRLHLIVCNLFSSYFYLHMPE